MGDYPRIVWAPANDEWMAEHGFMEWQCALCGERVYVSWHATCDLYDTEEPILPADGQTNSWQVECQGGHVLLLCHEVAEDQSADSYEPPTTKQIAVKLATEADLIEWQDYEQPKPPWAKVEEVHPKPPNLVPDLMAALEDSLAAAKAGAKGQETE